MNKRVKIEDVAITNFRSLVDVEVDFKTNLTALIGANGAGKTNILQGILLLRKLFSTTTRYERIQTNKSDIDPAAHSILTATFNTNGTRFKLKADIFFDSSEENYPIIDYTIKLRNLETKPSTWKSLKRDSRIFLDYVRRNTEHSLLEGLSDGFLKRYLTSDDKLNAAFMDMITSIEKMTYYSATQFSDPSRSPVSLELINDRLAHRSSRYAAPHSEYIHDLFRLWKKETIEFERYLNVVGPDGLGLVDTILFSEYEAPSNSFKVLTGGIIKQIEQKRTIVVPTFTVDSLQLSPSQLSEGTFKTLALVFHILNDKGDMILIEEPEVSVHHGLLGSILELIEIRSAEKQIVISTHSDYVLDKLSPENVIIVTKTSEGTVARSVSKTLSTADLKALKMYLNEIGSLGDYWKEGGFLSD